MSSNEKQIIFNEHPYSIISQSGITQLLIRAYCAYEYCAGHQVDKFSRKAVQSAPYKSTTGKALCRGIHYDVIKWKHFPHYWPFVRGIPRSPVNSPHKGQWRGTLIFSLISAWINGEVNNREAGYLRRHRTHYDVTLMFNMRHNFRECRNYYTL